MQGLACYTTPQGHAVRVATTPEGTFALTLEHRDGTPHPLSSHAHLEDALATMIDLMRQDYRILWFS